MDVICGYRTKVSDSDSDSDDSDKEFNDWKRAPHTAPKTESLEPVKNDPLISEPVPQQNQKRKRNTVWSDVLEDQLISEDLHHFGIKKKPKNYGSRGLESYDYTLRYSDPRVPQPMDDKDCEGSQSEGSDANSFVSSKSKHNDRYVKLDSTELAAARKIVMVLQEKKRHLIFRVVKYMGVEKAMSLLKMTEQIEESGGMMIKNHARRRTPGGVYIQLLKSDTDVSKEVLDKIFEGEMSGFEMKKYFDERREQKKYLTKKNKKKKKRSKKQNKCQDSIKLESDEKDSSVMEDQAINDANIVEMEQVFPENKEVCSNAPKDSSDSNLEDGEIQD